LLIAGTIWLALPERQPSYLGRPLNYWLTLKNNDDSEALWYEPYFKEAIQHMGTNSLPNLLEWIAYEPPIWKTKLINALSGLRWIPERFQEDRAERLALGAEEAFLILGRHASAVIPELSRLARNPSGGTSAYRAAYIVLSFGPESQGVVLDLLKHPDPSVRSCAISSLRDNTNASTAIPSLVVRLKDPDDTVAALAAGVLGDLQLRPELSIPALTNALQDGRSQVADAAHTALAKFGLVPLRRSASEPFRFGYPETNSSH